MKAHYSKLSKGLHKEAVKVGEDAFRTSARDHTRRMLKIFCIALSEQFGFGAERCQKAIDAVTLISDKHMDDEAFWIHADRRLKQLKIPFQEENYEEMHGL